MEAWMNSTHPDVRAKKKVKDALRQTSLLEYTFQSGTTPGFPALQGQLCQPASTVGAPALQLAAVPDSSALTGSLLMPQVQVQVQVQVQLKGILVLEQCRLLLARRRSRQHGLMDAEVQSKEEEQIVSSGTGEIKAGRGSTARKCQMEK
eukprot:gene21389-25103_t